MQLYFGEAYRTSSEDQTAGMIATQDRISAELRELSEKAQLADVRAIKQEPQSKEIQIEFETRTVDLERLLAARQAELVVWAPHLKALETWGHDMRPAPLRLWDIYRGLCLSPTRFT